MSRNDAAVELLTGGLRPIGAEAEGKHLLVEGDLVLLVQRALPATAVVGPADVPARAPDPVPEPEVRNGQDAASTAAPPAPAASPSAPIVPVGEEGQQDQDHEEDEVDHQHDHDPRLERPGEERPCLPLEAGQERLGSSLHELGIELIEELPGVGHGQVSVAALQQGLERLVHFGGGEAGGRHHIPGRGPAFEVFECGEDFVLLICDGDVGHAAFRAKSISSVVVPRPRVRDPFPKECSSRTSSPNVSAPGSSRRFRARSRLDARPLHVRAPARAHRTGPAAAPASHPGRRTRWTVRGCLPMSRTGRTCPDPRCTRCSSSCPRPCTAPSGSWTAS